MGGNENSGQLPGVFVNGIWKSGNRLLNKLIDLLGLPHKKFGLAASTIEANYFLGRSIVRGGWLDRSPVLVGMDIPMIVSRRWLNRRLADSSGHYFTGHSAYSDTLADILDQHKIKPIQIVRDPRDIIVSLAYWIENQPDYYAYRGLIGLPMQERMQAVIKGFYSNTIKIESLATVLDRSYGWLTRPKDVLVVRFENLVGLQGGGSDLAQLVEIEKVSQWIGVQEANCKLIANQLFGGTRTFRAGRVNSWELEYSPETRKLFDETVGPRLALWGY